MKSLHRKKTGIYVLKNTHYVNFLLQFHFNSPFLQYDNLQNPLYYLRWLRRVFEEKWQISFFDFQFLLFGFQVEQFQKQLNTRCLPRIKQSH